MLYAFLISIIGASDAYLKLDWCHDWGICLIFLACPLASWLAYLLLTCAITFCLLSGRPAWFLACVLAFLLACLTLACPLDCWLAYLIFGSSNCFLTYLLPCTLNFWPSQLNLAGGSDALSLQTYVHLPEMSGLVAPPLSATTTTHNNPTFLWNFWVEMTVLASH